METMAMERQDVNVQEPTTPRSFKKRCYEEMTPEKPTQAISDESESGDDLRDMLE